MNIGLNQLRRLPFNTVFAVRNYGFDNTLPPSDACPGSKLCMAILRCDHLETIKLLEQNAPISHHEEPDGWTPLIYSIYYNNLHARKMLFELHASPSEADYANRTPLMFAAIKNDPELIVELFCLGADVHAVDHCGKTALDFAIEYHNTESIKILRRLI